MGMRPHDLLRLASPAAIEAIDPPGWVAAALARAPWAVVRRAGEAGGRVAVGVRGADRSERFAASVRRADVVEVARPEELAARRPPRPHPVFEAIERLRPALEATGAPWGPTGSAGFELATGRATLTAESDLDLVLRPAPSAEKSALERLAEAAAGALVRVDVLLEFDQGAVSLAEFLGASPELLLRTPEGPRLAARGAFAAAC